MLLRLILAILGAVVLWFILPWHFQSAAHGYTVLALMVACPIVWYLVAKDDERIERERSRWQRLTTYRRGGERKKREADIIPP